MLDLADEEQRFRRIGDFVRQDAEAALAVGRQLSASTAARERCLGADVLGQLATIAPAARGQIVSDLLAALDPEDEGEVIASLVVGLGGLALGGGSVTLFGASVGTSAPVSAGGIAAGFLLEGIAAMGEVAALALVNATCIAPEHRQ